MIITGGPDWRRSFCQLAHSLSPPTEVWVLECSYRIFNYLSSQFLNILIAGAGSGAMRENQQSKTRMETWKTQWGNSMGQNL